MATRFIFVYPRFYSDASKGHSDLDLIAIVQTEMISQVDVSDNLDYPRIPSLNIALDHVFNWFDARYEAQRIWFGREEYGGERDILLLPWEIVSLDHRKAFLWTPTTSLASRCRRHCFNQREASPKPA